MIVVAVILYPVITTVIISKMMYAPNAVKSCLDKRHERVKYSRKIKSSGTSKKLLDIAKFLLQGTEASNIPDVIRLYTNANK